MTSDLIPRATAAALVAVYTEQVARIREAFGAVADAELKLNAAFNPGEMFGGIHVFASDRNVSVSWNEPERAIAELKRECWRAVVDRFEIWRMLSTTRAKELEERLRTGDLPELTEDAIADLAAFYAENHDAIMAECVREVFEWLRPDRYARTAALKTNQKHARFELGEKVILSWCVETHWIEPGRFRIRYELGPRFVALEKVFGMLDGRGDFGRSSTPEIVAAIEASPDGTGETEYFAFRACKNRNLHLSFKRADLVARLNRIAGGANLKPSSEAA